MTEEDFLNTWDEKSRAVKEAADKKMRRNVEHRSRRLRPVAGGDGQGGGGGEEPQPAPSQKVLLPFLLHLRMTAAVFAGIGPEQLQHVVVTEYCPGAGIGWRRDKSVFGETVVVSLLSQCVLYLRRKVDEKKWERANVEAALFNEEINGRPTASTLRVRCKTSARRLRLDKIAHRGETHRER